MYVFISIFIVLCEGKAVDFLRPIILACFTFCTHCTHGPSCIMLPIITWSRIFVPILFSSECLLLRDSASRHIFQREVFWCVIVSNNSDEYTACSVSFASLFVHSRSSMCEPRFDFLSRNTRFTFPFPATVSDTWCETGGSKQVILIFYFRKWGGSGYSSCIFVSFL